jgi:probable phosphoglycerate mutase
VFLLRHADVENPRQLLYGHLPGFGLSPIGRAQATALGRRLRVEGIRRIVHSPLRRAAETAELIAAELQPRPELASDPELREAEFSRYLQGVPYWQIPLRRPRWYIHKLRRGLLPDDESYDAMGGRVLAVASRLAHQHPGETSAVVSHADPLQAAWIILDGRPRSEREMYRRPVPRAGGVRVDYSGDQVAEVAYIPPPGREPSRA